MKKQGHRQRKKELEAKANKRRFPELNTINIRRDGIGLLLLFIGVFTLYAISAPRTIVLEDDGLFVSAAWFLLALSIRLVILFIQFWVG